MIGETAKIFSGSKSQYLTDKICEVYGTKPGKINLQIFSDGEFQPKFEESVRGEYVFLVQSTSSPSDNLMELLLMIDAAKRASAKYIVAVIPYFGFSRQDRKDKPRVAIGSKLVANLLTSAGANRIITLDLHAPQIQGYFDIPVDHLESAVVFVPYIERLNLDNITFAAPDVGSTKRMREIADYFSADMVICDKHRKASNAISSMVLIGDVKDKNVILIDDICDTAGTLTKSAELIKQQGAKSVRAFCTHPILSGNAHERIDNSVLDELVLCDTIPIEPKKSKKIKYISTAKLFSVAIRNAHENKSITELFVLSKHKFDKTDENLLFH